MHIRTAPSFLREGRVVPPGEYPQLIVLGLSMPHDDDVGFFDEAPSPAGSYSVVHYAEGGGLFSRGPTDAGLRVSSLIAWMKVL